MGCPKCEQIIRDIDGSGWGGDFHGVGFMCDDCSAKESTRRQRENLKWQIERLQADLKKLEE